MDGVIDKLEGLLNRWKQLSAEIESMHRTIGDLEAQNARLSSEVERLKKENAELRQHSADELLGSEWIGIHTDRDQAKKQLDALIDKINRIIETLKTDVGDGQD